MLCALRLRRAGADVVLATSSEWSDDLLASIASEAGISVIRGELDDVLGRFAACVVDLEEDDLVVRVTADNPIPDASFVTALIHLFDERKSEYLATGGAEAGVPYGLAGEVFGVRRLRDAARNAVSQYDREHVTPYLMRSANTTCVTASDLGIPSAKYSTRRCTIDTLEDYLLMAGVFRAVGDVVSCEWHSFLQLLPVGIPSSLSRDDR